MATQNDYVKSEVPLHISEYLYSVLLSVSKASKITIKDIKGKRRFTGFVAARQVYCYAAYTNKPFPISYAQIAQAINKDHATAIYSIETVNKFINIKDKRVHKILSRLNIVFYETYNISYKPVNLLECIRTNTYLTLEIYKEHYL